MDITEVARLGGASSRKNLSPKQSTKLAKDAAKASWDGHKKGDKLCTCARCSVKKDVA